MIAAIITIVFAFVALTANFLASSIYAHSLSFLENSFGYRALIGTLSIAAVSLLVLCGVLGYLIAIQRKKADRAVAECGMDLEKISEDYEVTIAEQDELLRKERDRCTRLTKAFHIAHRIIHDGRNATNDILVAMDQGKDISKRDIHKEWERSVGQIMSHIAELFSEYKGASCSATLKIIGQRNAVLFTFRDEKSARARKNSIGDERVLSPPMRRNRPIVTAAVGS